MRVPKVLMRRLSYRRGWYREACEGAAAARLRERSPGYIIPPRTPEGWNAVHDLSGTVLGPVRTVGQLEAEIDLDRWSRVTMTATGVSIRIRPGGAR